MRDGPDLANSADGGVLDLVNQSGDDGVGVFENRDGAVIAKAKGCVEAYLEHRVYLDLAIRKKSHSPEVQLSLGCSPFGEGIESSATHDGGDSDAARNCDARRQDFVAVSVPDLVHGPEGPITSFVWSVGYDDLENISMKVVASLDDLLLDRSGSVAEREFAALGIRLAGCHLRTGIQSVIQRVPKFPEYPLGLQGELGREIRLEADLQQVLPGLRIELLNEGPIVWVDEIASDTIECVDAFLRPFEEKSSAAKRLIHD